MENNSNSDFNFEERLFLCAAENYVTRKVGEYAEFYLDELSKHVGYKVTLQDLKDIISDEIETVSNDDSSLTFTFLPELNTKFKLIRKGSHNVELYLDCLVISRSDGMVEIMPNLIYNRKEFSCPVKPTESIKIKRSEIYEWRFKY